MSDLVGNPKDRFSQNEAHIKRGYTLFGMMLSMFETLYDRRDGCAKKQTKTVLIKDPLF